SVTNMTLRGEDDDGHSGTSAAFRVEPSIQTPTITWPTPGNIVYGTALSGTQLNASAGNVAGTFAYSPPAGTILNAGSNQRLSVTFTPTDTNSYLPVTTNVNITVLKASLMITANNTNKVYG